MTTRTDTESRLLIVENNDAFTDAVERAGLGLNLIVDKATDGWDAIAKLEEHEYDAIVVDANLPRYSGFGVVTYLREEHGHLENLILMTDTDEADISRRLGEDSVQVIRKTECVEDLASAIGECARRSAGSRQR